MMDDSYYKVKYRLIDYLKESKIPVSDSEEGSPTVICPCCGGNAKVIIIPLEETRSWWSCQECKEEGDTVKYAKEFFKFRNETQALQDVCRKLKVPITALDFVTAKDLMNKEYEPVIQVVEGLISPGLYILAGDAKIGKSWLMLDLAVAVSKGEPFLNRETMKSEVLYLSLEDPEWRIQNRLQRVSDGEAGVVYFATDVEPIGNGFDRQISAFLTDNKDVKLVIVDTFGKARGSNANKYGYIEDYAVMTDIKKLAMRFNVAIILVHHTRKREADDIMDMISGTNGILGCADSGMVLHRADRLDAEATLYTTSRDFEDNKFSIRWNKEVMRWKLREDNDWLENNEILAAVVNYVRRTVYWEGTATDLLEELMKIDEWIRTKPNGLARMLNAEKRKMREKYNIEYRKGRGDNEKLIILIDIGKRNDLDEEPSER